jgi:hypothetical protein
MTVLLPDSLLGRFGERESLIEKWFYQSLKLATLYSVPLTTLNKFLVLSDESLAFVVTVSVFELTDYVTTLEVLKDHSVPAASTIEF